MKFFMRYFLQGIIYIAPMAITGYIIYLIFDFVDGILETVLYSILGMRVPGLGLLIIIMFLVMVGYLGQSILARPFKTLFKSVLLRVPILNFIYSAFNDLFAAFVGKEKKFNRPVLVVMNPPNKIEKMGFLTEEDLSGFGETDKVAVYFPHSYNFSGEMFIVPVEQVRPLNINPTDAMKFVVSGGVAGLHPEDDSLEGEDSVNEEER
jgi:uncharacterized membrane protein